MTQENEPENGSKGQSNPKDTKRPSPFDLSHPMLKPLWVRLGLTLGCLAWVVVELSIGSPIWATLFGAMGLYMGWAFFVKKV